jgi:hypothetical protein
MLLAMMRTVRTPADLTSTKQATLSELVGQTVPAHAQADLNLTSELAVAKAPQAE